MVTPLYGQSKTPGAEQLHSYAKRALHRKKKHTKAKITYFKKRISLRYSILKFMWLNQQLQLKLLRFWKANGRLWLFSSTEVVGIHHEKKGEGL